MHPFLTGLFTFASAPIGGLGADHQQMAAANLTVRHLLLDEPASAFAFGSLQEALTEWLKVDIKTMAAVVTLVGSLSGALAAFHSVSIKCYWWVTKFLTASVSVPGNDRLNREIIGWISANVLTRQGTRVLAAGTETIKTDDWHFGGVPEERHDVNFDTRVPVRYFPTFGLTWFIFERRVFVVKRIPLSGAISERSSVANDPDEYAAAPQGFEPLLVLCLGRSVAPIKRFFDACRDHADLRRDSFVRVRAPYQRYHRCESWDMTVLRPLRPLETVHFDEGTKAALVADIANYLDPETRHFYMERGIPYRRGYLLHGPPGTGKTSLSLALASRFKLDLYILHIPSIREDSEIEQLFAALPHRCIVLLEDIDAVGITSRKEMRSNMAGSDGNNENSDGEDEDSDDDDDDKHSSHSRCTLSGLLNVLDGVASQEGRIVLMTSNLPDKLDRALVRPGRIDRMIYLGNISRRSAELMFIRMFDPVVSSSAGGAVSGTGSNEKKGKGVGNSEALHALAGEFASQIPEETFTPAQLQGYLLGHRSSPEAAVAGCGAWAAEEKERMDEVARRTESAARRRERRQRAKKLAKRLAKELTAPKAGADDEEKSTTREAKGKDGEKQNGGKEGQERTGEQSAQSDGTKTPESYDLITTGDEKTAETK